MLGLSSHDICDNYKDRLDFCVSGVWGATFELWVDGVAAGRRYPVNGHKRSLREIAAELEAQGYVAEGGKHGGGFSCRPEREGLTQFKHAGSDA